MHTALREHALGCEKDVALAGGSGGGDDALPGLDLGLGEMHLDAEAEPLPQLTLLRKHTKPCKTQLCKSDKGAAGF